MNVDELLDELPNGTSFYSKVFNVMFYRSNGVDMTIPLPQGKTVESIIPFHAYSVQLKEDNYSIIYFDRTPEYGRLIKINLKDNL